MELNSCSSHDDNTSAAFVRDWRIRKISPVNNKLTNPDTAPIVRRRTVITIGSTTESDGSIYQQEDQTISASEVGETACGRISITVKTIPKTPSIQAIPASPTFSPDLHAEEEWTARDTVPFKSSSVSDPSWIYVPSKPDRSYSSKILQRPQWKDETSSQDVDLTLADNKKMYRTLSNKSSSYKLTEIELGPSVDSRSVNSDGITSQGFESSKITLKPTFKMTFGDETKILRLVDTTGSEKSVRKVEKLQTNSISRSPIGYHEWLKSLDRLEGETYPNQTHSSDDDKKKHRDTKLLKFTDCPLAGSSAGKVNKSSDTTQSVNLVASSPKSILKNVQNESNCEIRQQTVNLIKNQPYKDVAAGIVGEVSPQVFKASLTKPINSLINTKHAQDWTVEKSSSSLVSLAGKSDYTKSSKVIPTKGNQVAAAPKVVEDCPANGLSITMKVDRASTPNSVEIVNKNQINSMRSLSSSGSWKKNSNTQDGTSSPTLSSGMDLSKATELVRQFFNTGNEEDTDSSQSASLVTDKKPVDVTNSGDQTISILHPYQSPAAQSTSSGSPEYQPGSVQDQRYAGHHHRGRSPIKSKIPLRIPRPASSSACSHSGSNSTLTTPSVAYVEKGSYIPTPKNCAFNKAKSATNMLPSRIKPPSTGSAVRTRSVENLRQTSPLSSYVLYSNIMMARDEETSQYQ